MLFPTPTKLFAVSVLLVAIISSVDAFTVAPAGSILHTTNSISVQPMISLPTARLPSSSNINGGGVCALNLVETPAEGRSRKMEAKVTVAENNAKAYLWNLLTNLQTTEEVWACISTLYPIYNGTMDMIGKSNTLDYWNELGATMHPKAKQQNSECVKKLKGYSRLMMKTANKYNGQHHAPDHFDLVLLLGAVGLGLEKCERIKEKPSDCGVGIVIAVGDAEVVVDGYMTFLVTHPVETAVVWNALQGTSGKLDEWYGLGANMITEAPNGGQPIKLAKCDTVVQSTCSTHDGQPVPT